jgi:hypothetical protein
VGEESGGKMIHTVCLLGLNVEMLMVVWRSIYLGDVSLPRSIFNPANEQVYPSILAYVGPNAHVELVHIH